MRPPSRALAPLPSSTRTPATLKKTGFQASALSKQSVRAAAAILEARFFAESQAGAHRAEQGDGAQQDPRDPWGFFGVEFDRIDTNHDGVLSLQEVSAGLLSSGWDAAQVDPRAPSAAAAPSRWKGPRHTSQRGPAGRQDGRPVSLRRALTVGSGLGGHRCRANRGT